MSDDTIRRSDAIKAFTLNSKGERIPFVDCDNFPVEFPLRYIVDTLSALPPADRPTWIPCSERLPEANKRDEQGFYKAYLVQRGSRMHTARWNGTHWVLWTIGSVLEGVVAWMPLPNPWKGADDEND